MKIQKRVKVVIRPMTVSYIPQYKFWGLFWVTLNPNQGYNGIGAAQSALQQRFEKPIITIHKVD